MITKEQYDDIRARLLAIELWQAGRHSYAVKEFQESGLADVTNDERSQVEEYEWMTNPPEKYFLYINETGQRATATTWTGQLLGQVSFGQSYRDNFGGKRIPVTVQGTNGREYYGTYFTSAGNYARIKARKTA